MTAAFYNHISRGESGGWEGLIFCTVLLYDFCEMSLLLRVGGWKTRLVKKNEQGAQEYETFTPKLSVQEVTCGLVHCIGR
jgi:hypothetical protein